MHTTHCVIICGQSIFAHALEAALLECAGLDVVRLHPHLPAIIERISALHPILVLLECDGEQGDLMLNLLDRGVPLVTFDSDAGQGMLFTGRPVALTSQHDLNQLIGQLAMNPSLPEGA